MSNDKLVQHPLSNVTPLEKIEILRSHRIAINFAMMNIMEERKAVRLVASMTKQGEARRAFNEVESTLLDAAIELANQLESVHSISA